MKSLYIQLLAGLFLSLSIVTLAKLTGSVEISTFIRSNGLLALLALLAINSSTACYALARLSELEHLIKKPYYFDTVKIKLRQGFLEQLWATAVLIVLLALTPPTWWADTSYWSFSTLFTTLALSCITHTTYCTYDFSITAINVTISPDRH